MIVESSVPRMKLSHVQGQPLAMRYLENYLRNRSKIPPLLLFTGPDGVGKYTTAELFSRTLLCHNENDCGTCPSCRLMDKGQHPDYIALPVGQSIKIGNKEEPDEFTVRWLQYTRVIYRPHFSKFRVVLFPDAGLISNDAETALLKTLEESPPHTKFIFLVNNILRVKQTIVSRAIEVPFQYLSVDSLRSIHNSWGDLNENPSSYGGSLNPFDIDPENLELVNQKIQDMSDDSVQLLHLEIWIKNMKENHKGWKGEFHYSEFLDLVVNVLMHQLTKKDYEKNIHRIERLLEFKRDLHRNIGGLDSFLLSKLFFYLCEGT